MLGEYAKNAVTILGNVYPTWLDLESLNASSTSSKMRGFSSSADLKFDIIVCNPPHIPLQNAAQIHGMDSGSYDMNERFLTELLQRASEFLKPEGTLLLIYSDLALRLGLQEPQRVEALCKEYPLPPSSSSSLFSSFSSSSFYPHPTPHPHPLSLPRLLYCPHCFFLLMLVWF